MKILQLGIKNKNYKNNLNKGYYVLVCINYFIIL